MLLDKVLFALTFPTLEVAVLFVVAVLVGLVLGVPLLVAVGVVVVFVEVLGVVVD